MFKRKNPKKKKIENRTLGRITTIEAKRQSSSFGKKNALKNKENDNK